MWASYKGNEMVVQEYLERGADPNVKAEVLKYLCPPSEGVEGLYFWCRSFQGQCQHWHKFLSAL